METLETYAKGHLHFKQKEEWKHFFDQKGTHMIAGSCQTLQKNVVTPEPECTIKKRRLNGEDDERKGTNKKKKLNFTITNRKEIKPDNNSNAMNATVQTEQYDDDNTGNDVTGLRRGRSFPENKVPSNDDDESSSAEMRGPSGDNPENSERVDTELRSSDNNEERPPGDVGLQNDSLGNCFGKIATDIDSIYLIGMNAESVLNRTTLASMGSSFVMNRFLSLAPLMGARHSIMVGSGNSRKKKKAVPLHKFPGVCLAQATFGAPPLTFSICLSLVANLAPRENVQMKMIKAGRSLSSKCSTVILMALNLAKALHGDQRCDVLNDQDMLCYIGINL